MAEKKKPKNYVNNADLYLALKDYLDKCNKAQEDGKEIPQVPNYIGLCIKQISERMATRQNFSGYSFRDEMIMDGIENSLRYIRTYNLEYTNPFGWFSQIIWNAFLHKIGKEHKQLYIKFKSSQTALHNMSTFGHEGEDYDLNFGASPEYMNDFIENYESKMKTKKKVEKKEIL